jgi:hypothetical protein
MKLASKLLVTIAIFASLPSFAIDVQVEDLADMAAAKTLAEDNSTAMYTQIYQSGGTSSAFIYQSAQSSAVIMQSADADAFAAITQTGVGNIAAIFQK